MSKFMVWSEDIEAVTVVHLQGTLDGSTALALAQTLESLLQEEKYRLVLEVRQLWGMDQVGLQVLLSSQSQAQEKGGDVKLAIPSTMVRELLEVPEMKERFLSFTTVQEAMDSYPRKAKKKPRKVRLPIPMNKEIGLGDLIKGLTSAIGIKPCGGCEQRAEKLNNMVTISGRQNGQQAMDMPDS